MKLQTLGAGQGYLKAGFLGFAKSGKTWTSCLLAIGVRRQFGLAGPIAMLDTEGGSEYVAPLIRRETGQSLLGIKSRSYDDLLDMGRECLDAQVAVLIVDSITHVWRELCDAYLKQLNDRRRQSAEAKGWRFAPKTTLEFQDWAQVKGRWAAWADFYLNCPMHIIICGRAGYEYDMETNPDTGKKELVKTGIKMKTEGEFGFEPSLLVEMERLQTPTPEGGYKFGRQATVLGDRFGLVDGKVCVDPTYEFFAPHVQALTAGAHTPVDTRVKSDLGVSEDGDAAWARERRTRTILTEEIQGVMVSAIPGQSAEEKKRKADLLAKVFSTRSWTAVESMSAERLREGLATMKVELGVSEPRSTPVSVATPMAASVVPLTPVSAAPPVSEPVSAPVSSPISAHAFPPAPAPIPAQASIPGQVCAPAEACADGQAAPPAAPAQPAAVDQELPPEVLAQLEQVIGANGPQAVKWLWRNGWLPKGKGIEALPLDRAKSILARQAQFIRAIAPTL